MLDLKRLVDFALDPNAQDSMGSMIRTGTVEGVSDVGSGFNAGNAGDRAWLTERWQSVSHRAADGKELLGWEVPARPDAVDLHAYAVCCHGYVGKPLDMATYARHFHDLGATVLLPAARGHERNAGSGYIQMGWQDSADLVGWVNDIVARDPAARIGLFGVSMGGAEVMMAAGRDLPPQVRLIVEDCGYTSVADEFSYLLRTMFHVPAAPVLALVAPLIRRRAGFRLSEASAVRQLRRARVPMLFIHGDQDDFVPFSMLDICYEACASPVKERLAVPGAPHVGSLAADPGRYWQVVDDFIFRHLA